MLLTSSDHVLFPSALHRWPLESPRRAPRSIPLQEPEHRFREPHLPPQHRRAVRFPHHPGSPLYPSPYRTVQEQTLNHLKAAAPSASTS